MNILVTGATGFAGSHLVNRLKTKNRVISLIHNPPMGIWQSEALEGTVKVQSDIRDTIALQRIISRFGIKQVYHTAALATVKTAHLNPLSTYDINVMGTVALLEACRKVEVNKVLVLNTDKVYGEGLDIDESEPFIHHEPYATSKSCQGLIVRSYIDIYGMNIVMPHSCNIFGYDPYSNRIVPNVVKFCLKKRRPFIFTNDTSIREYIYIDDLVNALIELMNGGDYTDSFNLVTGDVFNQREVVLEILKSFDLKPRHVKGKLPPQIQNESLSTLRDWEWAPRWTFSDAIELTIEKFRKYSEDWKN